MMEDPTTGSLVPFDFEHLQDNVPELRRFNFQIDSVSFDEPIDSSDITIASWQRIAQIIEVNYEHYEGFVILHGTDTMAYSSSALSFMLENLGKPVIFTGSQLPIGRLRTDGKENLITAVEIASAKQNDVSIIQEVCIYFQSQLFRGNRTHKYSTENFDAFECANMDALAEVGIHIEYKPEILFRSSGKFRVKSEMDNNVAVLKIYPGMSQQVVSGILGVKGLRAVVLETYGSGNAFTNSWFLAMLENAIKNDLLVLNITQCDKGFVDQGLYETSTSLQKIGVIGGADMTSEAAITKLMFLLGQPLATSEVKQMLHQSLRGELTSYPTL